MGEIEEIVVALLYLEGDVLGYEISRIDSKRGGVERSKWLSFWSQCLSCVTPLNNCRFCSGSFNCYERLKLGNIHLLPAKVYF